MKELIEDVYDSRLRSVLLTQEIGYLNRGRKLFLAGFALGLLIGSLFISLIS